MTVWNNWPTTMKFSARAKWQPKVIHSFEMFREMGGRWGERIGRRGRCGLCVCVCSVTRRAIEHDREVEGKTRQEKRSDGQEIKHERRPDEINKRRRNLSYSAPAIPACWCCCWPFRLFSAMHFYIKEPSSNEKSGKPAWRKGLAVRIGGGGANATQRETKGDATRTNSRKSRDLFICSKVNGASRLKGCIIYLTCMRAFGKAHAVEAERGRTSCKCTKRAPLVCNVSPTQKGLNLYSMLAAFGQFWISEFETKA